jgi:hypothetical protein
VISFAVPRFYGIFLYVDLADLLDVSPPAPESTQKPVDLSSLLAIRNPMPGVAAAAPAGPAPDIRQLALDKMAAAGQLYAGATMTMPEREERAPRVFGRIEEAGPKPRKKRETAVSGFEPENGSPGKKSVSTDELLAGLGVDPQQFSKKSRFADARRREGVGESPEFFRIRALPRRPMDVSQFPDLTERYKKPGGTMRLRPIQSAILHDAEKADGILAPVACGAGKALASLLLPTAMRSKRAVLLVPPQLKRKALEIDIPTLHRHWQISLGNIRVIAYSELSSASCAQLLDEINPDLIVADECHNLRHKSAARTKRFLRYMKEHPHCRFAGLSGTITRRSIMDYQHLIELALRKNSPVPAHWGVLVEWAEALDVPRGSNEPMHPGVLLSFCSPEEIQEISGKTVTDAQPLVRHGYRRRLTETPGVIATEESAVDTSLVITGLHPMVPAEVQVPLKHVRDAWEIDGEELVDPMSVSRAARELAGGFFYRWVWPGGVKDFEWLQARSNWNKELRQILKLNRRGLDSPLEVITAILAGKLRSDTWAEWARVKDRPKPPTEPVWLSDYLIEESARWARETCSKASPGIIWYSWDAFGQRLAEKTGLPVYGPGTKNDPSFADPKKEPVIICSLAAHGTGKDLQRYCHNLVTTPPGALEWEQGIARTHRPGQEADEVTVDVFLHTMEMQGAWDKACADARYIEDTQGQKQRILYADKVDCGEGSGFCF